MDANDLLWFYVIMDKIIFLCSIPSPLTKALTNMLHLEYSLCYRLYDSNKIFKI